MHLSIVELPEKQQIIGRVIRFVDLFSNSISEGADNFYVFVCKSPIIILFDFYPNQFRNTGIGEGSGKVPIGPVPGSNPLIIYIV